MKKILFLTLLILSLTRPVFAFPGIVLGQNDLMYSGLSGEKISFIYSYDTPSVEEQTLYIKNGKTDNIDIILKNPPISKTYIEFIVRNSSNKENSKKCIYQKFLPVQINLDNKSLWIIYRYIPSGSILNTGSFWIVGEHNGNLKVFLTNKDIFDYDFYIADIEIIKEEKINFLKIAFKNEINKNYQKIFYLLFDNIQNKFTIMEQK